MIIEHASGPRPLKLVSKTVDVVVVGGGLSGVCAAISAARSGSKVVLIQDRPVLGGNASSEVRLWILGATSHGGNNNRWAREGGIINEILLENLFRNPSGSPLVLDSILQDWVYRESNLEVLVNTSVFHADITNHKIQKIQAFNSQNSTMYALSAQMFVDSSGDGILTHLSGAAYRMGAEISSEFDEPMAPGEDYGKLLGHSLYFYSKDLGHKVDYVAPEFALTDVPKLIPRYKNFSSSEHGCSLWWIEWGGRLDTIHQSEEIKEELQKIVYGVWDYIKNSGEFPDSANLALEWVGTIPGKRESRRAEGDYMLRQSDIIEQVEYEDNVCHGGWSIDLHPADGVYGSEGGCNQYHAKGIYGIPYRCLYSRNIENLFINGRLISASHVAFGSTRVMATSSTVGQAIGAAAALCCQEQLSPRDLLQPLMLATLKSNLSAANHYVPNFHGLEKNNLASSAQIQVSSELELQSFAKNGDWKSLKQSYAQILPQSTNSNLVTFFARTQKPSKLTVQLKTSLKPDNHSPELISKTYDFELHTGENEIEIELNIGDFSQYVFVCFCENDEVEIALSDTLLTGIVSVRQGGLAKVSTSSKQIAPAGLGVESFDFWVPDRRPKGQNVAFRASNVIHTFSQENLTTGAQRPIRSPNAWVARVDDVSPVVSLEWSMGVRAKQLFLYLDCDYDHPLESVQYQHHDRIMPMLVSECEVTCNGSIIYSTQSNHQAVISIDLPQDQSIYSLSLRLANIQGHPVSLFGIRVQ
ncbi:FAD-dependent oxidoreductase [Alginatibacterium sediminis]|uniref:FAD-dependent oxidoreductase n=1 Tax=Alginatibacterium sediminis TaxID=2164068 RepID=A0A420EB73_9ALTE|nr:FAD-dependent oxidoreductase [Alginatibacterium sediminis]RKF17904.1 FAD-dependent oxidoreductase [Alginatibacterium sediminis]